MSVYLSYIYEQEHETGMTHLYSRKLFIGDVYDMKNGNLSINSENIFPVIKKWLYSDHDIFIRELVSNGCDAITKLKKLDIMGEYTLPDDYKPSIQVVVDTEGKSLSFTDTGLGMTEDEVDEYINQVAFSGATDFLEKYKDKLTYVTIDGKEYPCGIRLSADDNEFVKASGLYSSCTVGVCCDSSHDAMVKKLCGYILQ